MSNGINKPGEDIKKYDASFLQEKKNPIVLRGQDTSIEDNAKDAFGFGFSSEELTLQQEYDKEQERKSKIDYSMSLPEKAGRSFVAGIGDLVEGLADAIDYFDGTPESKLSQEQIASGLSKDIYGIDINTPISDYVHGLADHLQSYGDSVQELQSTADISFASMFDIDFWFTHAARAIPFSLSFLVPGTLGAKGAAMAYRGLSAASKLEKGFRAGRTLKNLGLVSSMEKGSKAAQALTQFAGGALAGNLSEGAIIAGQVYNDAIEQGLNEKQAAAAAHDTYVDNAKWMAVDGLQIMGVMGLPKFLRSVMPTKLSKSFSPNSITKPSIKGVINNMAKAGGVTLTDATLEQFQEVYQDWASKSNIAEQKGESFMSYTDYFTSEEALPTRVIAFATSGIVSGAKTFIDVSAERKRQFEQKYLSDDKSLVAPNMEILEKETEEFELSRKEVGDDYTPGLSSTKRLAGMKENQLQSLLVFKALDGKLDYYQDLLSYHKEQGHISEQQFNDYMETSKQIEKLVEETPSYNLSRAEKAKIIISQQLINENNSKIERNLAELEAEKSRIQNLDISDSIKQAQLDGIQTRIDEVKAGEVEVQNKEGENITIRQENLVHRNNIENVYTEASVRKENERVKQEVVPKIKEILDKQSRNIKITEEEKAFIASEQKTYDNEKRIANVKKAQDIVGKSFVLNQSLSEKNTKEFTSDELANNTDTVKTEYYTITDNDGNSQTVEVRTRKDGSRRVLLKDEGTTYSEIKVSKDNTLTNEKIIDGQHPFALDENSTLTKREEETREGFEANYSESIVEKRKAKRRKEQSDTLVFEKTTTQGDKEVITRKTVSSNGTVTTETITKENIKKTTSEEAAAKAKEKENTEGRKASNKQTDDKTSKTDTSDENYYENRKTKQRANIDQKQADLDQLRQEKLFGNVSLGDFKVWAKNLEKENPFTMVFLDDGLRTMFGYDAIGKVAGLSLFINPQLAEQEVFHHESWHIYQKVFAGTKEMKELLKMIVRQPIFEKTKLKHLNYLRVKKGSKVVPLYDLISDNDSNVISLEEYIGNLGLQMADITDTERRRYLADIDTLLAQEGYSILPDAKQVEIKDEALAIAGGYQNTGDETVFKQAPKEQSKIKQLFKNTWSKIKKSSNEETAAPLLSSHYPDFYNNDFAIMLQNFRKEASKGVNNKISWENYSKMQDGFLAARNKTRNKGKAMMSIENAIANNAIINEIVQDVKDKFAQEEGTLGLFSSDALEEASEKFKQLSQSIVRDVLVDAKTPYIVDKPSLVDKIDVIYTKYPGIIESKIKQSIITGIQNVVRENADIQDLRFDQLIKEEYKRGVNDRVSKMLTGFVESFNENNKANPITTDAINAVIDDLISNHRHDSEMFIQEAIGVIKRNNDAKEQLFKQFIDYAKSDLKSPGRGYEGVLNNIYQYYKGFRHESVFQFNISEDNTIVIEEKLPKKLSQLSNKLLNNIAVNNRDDSAFAIRILAYLVTAQGKTEYNKESGIVNLFNKILLAEEKSSIVSGQIDESDLNNMKIGGMKIEEYFSPERLDEIIDFFLDINFNETIENYFKKINQENNAPKTNQEKIAFLLDSKDNYIFEAIQKSNLQKLPAGHPLIQEIISRFAQKVNKYYNLTPEQQKIKRAVKFELGEYFNNQGDKVRTDKLTIQYFDEKMSSVLGAMQGALAAKEDERNLLGQVQDAKNDMIGTFNKSSYLYDSFDMIERYFSDLKVEEPLSGETVPERIKELYKLENTEEINPYALALYDSEFSPSIGYMSGYYDGREGIKKGLTSRTINPKTLSAIKIMSIYNAYKNKQKQYKQYIGQAGDSGRHYFLNNAFTYTNKQILQHLNAINAATNNSLSDDIYNPKIQKLYDDLESEGFIPKLQRNIKNSNVKTKKYQTNYNAFKKAYLTNAINKFYIQDLFFNKSEAITNQDFLIDNPKRFKGVTSPRVPLEAGGTRILPIIFNDDKLNIKLQLDKRNEDEVLELNGVQVADSESFMLPKHQKILSSMFGALNPIGQNIKALYYGQNLDNTAFENYIGRKRVPVYLKSETKVLANDFVSDKEIYRAFQFALQEITKNLEAEGQNVIPVFYASSAIKGGLTKEEINNIGFSIQDLIGVSEDIVFLNKQMQQGVSKINLYDNEQLGRLKEFERKINDIYQFDDQQGNKMYGFDGSNYGIQTTLDNTNKTATISKQKIAAYNIFNTIESFESGNFENGADAIMPIKQALADLLQYNYDQNFANKNFDEVFSENKAILRNFADRFIAEKFGAEYIGNDEVINRVVSSTLKGDVMSLKMQGTFSIEMSDIGYNLAIDGKNLVYSDNLKSHRINENGQVEFAEIVMPHHAKRMGVKEGDLVIAARIPHSKPGDSPVYKVVDFNSPSAGNAVIVSSVHANLIGSDKDGDGLHINIKNTQQNLDSKQELENKYFDAVVNLYKEPEVYDIVMQPIDFTSEITDKGLNHIKDVLKINLKDGQNDLFIDEEEMIQDRFLGNFIGIIASMNRTFNYFARQEGADATIMYLGNENKAYRSGIKIKNKGGLVTGIDRISNVLNKEKLWLKYAQAANFIIDDTKFGNRAKLGIVQETANDFFLLLRMGVSLESTINLMYTPEYKRYVEGKAKGLSTRKAIEFAYPSENPDNFKKYPDLERSVQIDLSDNKGISSQDLYQLVETLSSYAKDIRTIQQVVNLDNEVPTNILSLKALEKQLEKTLGKQASFARAIDADPYLNAHRDILLNKYKPKIVERSIISEKEADRLIDSLSSFADLTDENTISLLYNSAQFYKLALESSQEIFNQKNFQSLYLSPFLSDNEALYEMSKGWIPIQFRRQEEINKKGEVEVLGMDEGFYTFYKSNQIARDLLNNAKDLGNIFANKITISPITSEIRYKKGRQYKTAPYEMFRFDFDVNTYRLLGSEKELNEYKKAFLQLPQELQEFFVGYEFYVNKFGLGTNQTLKAFLPNSVNKQIQEASKRIKKGSEATDISDVIEFLKTPDVRQSINSIVQEADNLAMPNKKITDAVALMELMLNYDPSKFAKLLNTNRDRNIVEIEEDVKLELGKPNLGRKSRGVVDYNMVFKSYLEEQEQEEINIELKANTKFTEFNALEHFSDALDVETSVKKVKGKPDMYLARYVDLNEGRFGKEQSLSFEAFARQAGLLKDNVSINDFAEVDFYKKAFNEANDRYSKYQSDLIKSEKLRQDMLKTIQTPKTNENLDDKYFVNLKNKISAINRQALELDDLAKVNLTKELYMRYSKAVSEAQVRMWKSTEEGRKLFDRIDYTANKDKDIDVASMWYSPGDFGQYHPTLAGVRRTLEVENMRMHRDMRNIQKELNEAYSDLVKSKYGLASRLVKGITQTPLFSIAYSNTTLAKNLFDKLIIQKSHLRKNKKGQYIYISETNLNSDIFNKANELRYRVKGTGQLVRDYLSPEEYRYASMVSKFTRFYAGMIKSKKDRGELAKDFNTRAYYTPLKTASMYETFKRRGIYGLYYKSLDKDFLYDDVFIEAENPITGKKETLTYRDFKAIYSTTEEEIKVYAEKNTNLPINFDAFSQKNRVKALFKAKKQAQKLYLSGKDVLGNPVIQDSGEMQAIEAEENQFNRYIAKRSRRAAYFASNNLHQAMYSYIKAMTFQFGTAYQMDNKLYKRLSFQSSEDDKGKLITSAVVNDLSAREFLNLEESGKGGKNFEGFDKQRFLVQAAKFRMQVSGKKNAAGYLERVVLQDFINGVPKKTITPFESQERALAKVLTQWTMYVGLGLNVKAAIANVIIGKYNSYRGQGARGNMLGIARFFGVDDLKSGKFDGQARKKVKLMLDEFGILTYRPQEQLEGAGADTWFDKLLFSPMTSAEFFIQSTQFLGDLTQEEFDAYYVDSNGELQVREGAEPLSADRIGAIVRKVSNLQGRGYSDLDQRMIQTYALANMSLQFKRWLPTYLVDRLGKAGYKSYIDDFGNIYSGSIPAALRNTNTLLNPKNLGKLDLGDKEAVERFRRGAVGLMLVSMLLLAASEDDETNEELKAVGIDLERLTGDMALLANMDDWKYLVSVPALQTLENMYMLVYHMAEYMIPGGGTGTYTRDAKYGSKGDLKATRRVAALLPGFLRGALEREQSRSERSRRATRANQQRRTESTR